MATRLPAMSWIPIAIATLLGLCTTIAVPLGVVAATDQWTILRTGNELTRNDGITPRYLSPIWTRCVAASRTPMNAGADLTLLTLVAASDQNAGIIAESAWNEGVARLRLGRQRYGWPFRAMFVDAIGIQGKVPKDERRRLLDEAHDKAGMRTGVVLWKAEGSGIPDKRFPLAVLPVGLVMDTAIFGAFWSLILFGPRALIRRRRMDRGLCVKCGYQLGSAERCPECGTQKRRAI